MFSLFVSLWRESKPTCIQKIKSPEGIDGKLRRVQNTIEVAAVLELLSPHLILVQQLSNYTNEKGHSMRIIHHSITLKSHLHYLLKPFVFHQSTISGGGLLPLLTGSWVIEALFSCLQSMVSVEHEFEERGLGSLLAGKVNISSLLTGWSSIRSNSWFIGSADMAIEFLYEEDSASVEDSLIFNRVSEDSRLSCDLHRSEKGIWTILHYEVQWHDL